MDVSIQDTLDVSNCCEIGADKCCWTISTAKPGNGIDQIKDDNLESYWQSDGVQPHLINIQFLRKVSVSKICFYLDYNLDESYTPKKMSIRAGISLHDLVDITAIELHEPIGWVTVLLHGSNTPDEIEQPLRTHFLQVQVHCMHQNGRDTHIRQVKIFSPRSYPLVMGNTSLDMFNTIEFQQFAVLR